MRTTAIALIMIGLIAVFVGLLLRSRHAPLTSTVFPAQAAVEDHPAETSIPSSKPSKLPETIVPRPFTRSDPTLLVVDEAAHPVGGAFVAASSVVGSTGADGVFPLNGAPRALTIWSEQSEPLDVILTQDDILPDARKTCVLKTGLTLTGRLLDQASQPIAERTLVASFGGASGGGN